MQCSKKLTPLPSQLTSLQCSKKLTKSFTTDSSRGKKRFLYIVSNLLVTIYQHLGFYYRNTNLSRSSNITASLPQGTESFENGDSIHMKSSKYILNCRRNTIYVFNLAFAIAPASSNVHDEQCRRKPI